MACSLYSGGLFSISVLFAVLFFLVLRKRDGIEGLAEETRPDGPGHRPSVVRPVEIVRPDLGQLLAGHRRAGDIDRLGVPAYLRHRDDVQLVPDVRKRPLPIRADLHLVGGHRFLGREYAGSFDQDVLAPIRAVQSHRQ